MSQFMINGVERTFPVPMDHSFERLLAYIRDHFVTDVAWVSSIRINGEEMTPKEEVALADRPVSEVGSVEVSTAHPRELAEDTLQTLLKFTDHLEVYCHQTADAISSGNGNQEFDKLIDGIATFTESLNNAKQILRVGLLSPVNLLEAEMLSVLSDLSDYYQKGDRQYVCVLLRTCLPQNVREWRERGIPAIIQARTS